MHYYIDGYNLLFRLVKSDKDLLEKRQKLITDLNKMIREVGMEATLVFDAYYRLGDGSRSHYDQLEIQFTGSKETADEFILEALKNSPDCSKEIVVTSDKKLAWYARRKKAKTQTVEDFVALLKKQYKNKTDPEKVALKKQLALKKEPIPIKKASPDALYLEQFEERYKKLMEKEPKQPKLKPIKKKRSTKIPEQEKLMDEQSEMERWRKIFET